MKSFKESIDDFNHKLQSKLTMIHSVGDNHELHTIHDVLKRIHPSIKMTEVGFNGHYHGISHFGNHTPDYAKQYKKLHNNLGGFSDENDGYGVDRRKKPPSWK